jgi:hypothetical protein
MASGSKDIYGRLEPVGNESHYEHYLESLLDTSEFDKSSFLHAILAFDGCIEMCNPRGYVSEFG